MQRIKNPLLFHQADYGEGHDYLCAKCAETLGQRDQAEAHLVTYLTAALGPWRDHWQARGLPTSAFYGVVELATQQVVGTFREPAKARAATSEGATHE